MYILYQSLLIPLLGAYVPVVLFRMAVHGKYLQAGPARLGCWPVSLRRTVARLPRPVWIHALSVGEVLSAVPLVRMLRATYPGVPLVLSTTTETGQKVARERVGDAVDAVFYLPLDAHLLNRWVVRRVDPRLFVLVETDAWPGLLHVLESGNVPAAYVNVRISDRSFKRYRWIRSLSGRMLRAFRFIGAQTERDAQRLILLGAPRDRVFVTGNLKFDVETEEVSLPDRSRLARELGIGRRRPVVVAGSTHAGEERLLFEVLERLRRRFPDLVFVVAPRDRQRFRGVWDLAAESGFPTMLRSSGRFSSDPVPAVVVLDTVGELARVYALADVAFVGGSLVPRGGHNLLEPALHGKPVLFGPHTEDFHHMALGMEEAGAGLRVAGVTDLEAALVRLLEDEAFRQAMGRRARGFCLRNRGAVRKTCSLLQEFV